jgi:hypothetical protein
MPAGAKVEDVKATFTDGVLEVSVPLPVPARPVAQKVPIQEATPQAETAQTPEKPELAPV